MAARRASSLGRGIVVALGCISAVWLIFTNCELIADYINTFIGYKYNFFEYFFSSRLSSFASLFLGLSFFAIIIRDLWALKKPLLWINLLFAVLCLLATVVKLITSPIPLSGDHSYIVILENISLILLMLAYSIYSVVGINSKRYQPFTFFFGVFCSLLVLVYHVLVITVNYASPDFGLFIPYITVFFANFFVFKCALYEK